ncbi:MAG: hypothetical protein KHY46_14820 [Clostridiales bacterium]|nr:hypothetical protein [Clostridiales bacterium]
MDKKIILVSHGMLASGMCHSVQMIIGEREDLTFFGMMPGEHYQPMVDAVEREAVSHPDTQYIVIADLLGGSVCNGMTTLTGHENIKLIAGMNMGLVIGLLLEPEALSDGQIEAKIREAQEINLLVAPVTGDETDGGENFF